MQTTWMRISVALVTAGALAGCGARADAEFYEGVPTAEGLTLELLGDDTEASGSFHAGDGVGLETRGLGAPNPPEHLAHLQHGIRGVNVALQRAFLGVHKLLRHEGAGEGDTRVYGPAVHDEISYRLTVKRLTRISFAFRLEAKPAEGGDEAWLAILGGSMSRGAEPHRGRGVLGINLRRLGTVDPTFTGTGVLVAAFGHRPEGKAVAFRAEDFTSDNTTFSPVTAAFVGHLRLDAGVRAVRLGTRVNLEHLQGGTAEKELVGLRARWQPNVGGRAVAVAVGGDIPVGQAYVGLSCWDALASETYKVVRWCLRHEDGTRGGCELVHEAGSAEGCRPELGTFTDAPEGSSVDPALEDGAPVTELSPPDRDPTDG